MKKTLLTSACTLAVVLIATFANSSVAHSAYNNVAALCTNQSVPSVKTVLPDNKESADDVQTPVNSATNNVPAITPTAQADLLAAVKNNCSTTNKNLNASGNSLNQDKPIVTATTASVTAAPAKATPVTTVPVTAVPVNTATVNNTAVKDSNTSSLKTATNNNCSYKDTNGETLTVKNVNLSNCKSVQDVVNKLEQTGLLNQGNINVQNITSLKDIQALLKSKAAGSNCPYNNSSNQTQPTAAPTNTPSNTDSTPIATVPPAPAATQAPVNTPAPATTNSGISSYADQVLQLVNIERTKQGLSVLSTTSPLAAAANKRAAETSQSFSHTRPNGTSFYTVLAEYGISYSASGENIAYGQRTPQEVVTGWMNSPGHRANILNVSFHKIGIGVYQSDNGTIYWSQLFTN